MTAFTFRRSRRALRAGAFGFCLSLLVISLPRTACAGQSTQRLSGHIPALVNRANVVGRAAPTEKVSLALTLPLRHEAQLDALLARMYDPGDALYGQYLTSEQIMARFAPTQADYEAVAAFARAQGLTIRNTHANRLVLNVEGAAQTVEAAFGVHLHNYRLPEGRMFRAPDGDPVVPARMAARLQSVVGLDTAGVWHTHNRVKPADPLAFLNPNVIGSGPGGGLSPSDIKTAYNLNSAAVNGSGQTLAVFELDGYKNSDITYYANYFGLPTITLQNVLVDGASGAAGSDSDEVTLDIELQMAMAPGASKILVYEGGNANSSVLDTYNRIATDNLAKSVSTSWGLDEKDNSSSTLNSENTIFKQMAAQGQSVFSAAGDEGAYDDGSTLSVDDPASQPYVTGVGGTSLTTNGAGGTWKIETTWNGGSITSGAGGGGVSAIWPLPPYQFLTGVVTATSRASRVMRNVPDVSLNADPNNGYAIYSKGRWRVMGGSSCAAPLWAGFTALVNQQRAQTGQGTLGFANPALYAVGVGINAARDFHDIADGSSNLYYSAVTGYDLATGWGSFNGANLLADLAGNASFPTPLYRLLNPATSLHLLSANAAEVTGLVAAGWIRESSVGQVYAASNVSGATAFYRLYNPATRDHFYTVDANERDYAQNIGYNLESVSGYLFTTAASGRNPLYRLYNFATGEHLFTSSSAEYNALPAPWNREGIVAYTPQ